MRAVIEKAGKKPAGIVYFLPFLLALIAAIVPLTAEKTVDLGGGSGSLDDPTRMMVFGTAYLWGAILCLMRSGDAIGVLGRAKGVLLLILFVAASALWSSFPMKVILVAIHLVGLLATTIAAGLYIEARGRFPYLFFAVALGVLLFLSVAMAVFLPDQGIHNVTYRWKGITTNPNHLGMVTVLAVWAALASFWDRHGWFGKLLALGVLATAFLTLRGSGSMTSTALCGLVILGVPVLAHMRNNKSGVRKAKLTSVVFVGFLGIIVLLAAKPELFSLAGVAGAAGRDPTLTGRTELWDIALMAFSEKLMVGWSFDSLASVLSIHTMKFGQFHNGFIDLGVRGGLVGIALFLFFWLELTFRLLRRFRADWLDASAFFVLCTVVLIWNMTESSFVRETHELWQMLTLVSIALAAHAAKAPAPAARYARPLAAQSPVSRRPMEVAL
ncbi:O-antigen ligase family protein [Lacibacterium aquatile]|uniref:O-antigen ligase family protein n=1 Tax=Lacibacterium aquatile TaxID=1168082 RepID=A0ABW5DWT7_9PROT